MSAVEWWLLAAVIAAGLAAVGHVAAARPPRPHTAPGGELVTVAAGGLAGLAQALLAVAVGLVALALLLALP